MTPTLTRTEDTTDGYNNIEYGFWRDGKYHYIHSFNREWRVKKHHPVRNEMSVILAQLRMFNFKFAEMNGLYNSNQQPVDFFKELIAQGFKIRHVAYDNINHPENQDSEFLEINGVGDTATGECKHFHYRCYDKETYIQIINVVQPLLSAMPNISYLDYQIYQTT